jgi:hypothetical protein
MIEIETVKSPSPQPEVEAVVTPVKKERVKVQRSAAPKVEEEKMVKKEKTKYETQPPPLHSSSQKHTFVGSQMYLIFPPPHDLLNYE